MKKMYKSTWKVIAIVSIIVLIVLIMSAILVIRSADKELEKENLCYYEICGDYPDANYQDKVCTCYDYDIIGELVVAKQHYMV